MTAPTLILGLSAAAVFTACFVVHVCTFVPGSAVSLDGIGPLHAAGVAALVVTLTHFGMLNQRAREAGWKDGELGTLLRELIPTRARLVFGILLVYVVASFAVFTVRAEGSPRVKDGRYELADKGKRVRDLTEAEYRDRRRLEVRGPTALWMLFSGVPAAYLLLLAPRVRAVLDAAETADPGAGDRPPAGVI